MKNTLTIALFSLLFIASAMSLEPSNLFAQDATLDAPLEGLPTLFSVKLSGGWGIGRSRQLYGYNGGSPIYWSTGEGVKMNLALDLPIIPIEVMNTDSFDVGASKTPVVALELEAATGYHFSTGGTTVDALPGGILQTTTRSTAYVPITLGLNARSSFGPGMPSIYLGAGGGVWLVALYEENISNSLDPTQNFNRKMTPPLPFGLYGAMGFEFPLAYSPDDGNSFFDLFGEIRLTEMSNYVYSSQITKSSGGAISTVNTVDDHSLLFMNQAQRSASNVSISLGIKFNIY
jgi:hypothetical protein